MQDHGGGASVTVHISKHSLFRLKITVGCRLCWCCVEMCGVYVCRVLCVCVEIACVLRVCGVCAESVWDVRFVCCVLWCRYVCCWCWCWCSMCWVVCCVCGVLCVVCVARLGTRKNPRVFAQNVSVCRFKTHPCVPAKGAHAWWWWCG